MTLVSTCPPRERDLGYVRSALDRAQPRRPAAIPLLWAALVLIGFSLLHLAPTLACGDSPRGSTPPMGDDPLPVLDRLLEHGVRLAISVLLARHEEVTFRRFKELLCETHGSLGAQLRKLEDAGYLTVRKEFENRRPVTWYALSPRGRKAVRAHLDALQSLIHAAGALAPGRGHRGGPTS